MNWDDLKVFLATSRSGRLDDAARNLRMDATTISRRLRNLERSLGQTLFERTRRGHKLTPAGEALVAKAEAMESVSFEIQSDNSSEEEASGRIRLGVTEGLGAYAVAPSLVKFIRIHPNIEVDLIALSGFVSVPKRQADMSIWLTRPARGPLKVRKLSDYSLYLYASKDYLQRQPVSDAGDDLRAHRLIGYVDDLIYSEQLRYFDDFMPREKQHLCSTSIVAQLRMIKSGAGIGFLPEFMAAQEPDLEKVLQDAFHVQRSFWLAVHEDVASLHRIRLMSDFLAGQLRNLDALT